MIDFDMQPVMKLNNGKMLVGFWEGKQTPPHALYASWVVTEELLREGPGEIFLYQVGVGDMQIDAGNTAMLDQAKVDDVVVACIRLDEDD